LVSEEKRRFFLIHRHLSLKKIKCPIYQIVFCPNKEIFIVEVNRMIITIGVQTRERIGGWHPPKNTNKSINFATFEKGNWLFRRKYFSNSCPPRRGGFLRPHSPEKNRLVGAFDPNYAIIKLIQRLFVIEIQWIIETAKKGTNFGRQLYEI